MFATAFLLMSSMSGLGIFTIIVLASLLVRWIMRRQGSQHARRRRIPKASTSPMSARTQARALDEAYTVMGPTTIREIQDETPTIDGNGNRRVLIRTRTIETVLGPIGPAGVERSRRVTLPGHGHVIPLSDTEFEVFRDRSKLTLEPMQSNPAAQDRIG